MKHPNRMLFMWFSGTLAFLMILISTRVSGAPSVDQQVEQIRQEWAVAKYELSGDEQDKAFRKIIYHAEDLNLANPRNAKVELWHGTVLATYASVRGGMSALKIAKESRKHLERALELGPGDETAFANAVLGTLYAKVPGWPVSFGNKKKAEKLFQTALQLDPKGMDSNFYYGSYLLDQNDYEGARIFLMRAKQAKKPAAYKVAERGRLREINADLRKIDRH